MHVHPRAPAVGDSEQPSCLLIPHKLPYFTEPKASLSQRNRGYHLIRNAALQEILPRQLARIRLTAFSQTAVSAAWLA